MRSRQLIFSGAIEKNFQASRDQLQKVQQLPNSQNGQNEWQANLRSEIKKVAARHGSTHLIPISAISSQLNGWHVKTQRDFY